MKQPCPACPDGNEWNSNGPTGRACGSCHGHGFIDEDDDESPYCECNLEPMEDEQMGNCCSACGKPLR